LDLLVANSCDVAPPNCFNGIVSVLLGHGDGTFNAPVTYHASGKHAKPIEVADVNGDGKLDLLVGACLGSSNCASGSVAVLLGNGDGTFQSAVGYQVGGGSSAIALALADLNGDGKLDVVALSCAQGQTKCSSTPEIFVLLGNGNGTFSLPAPRFYVAGNYYGGVGGLAAADFNSDGKPDVAGTTSNALSVLVNILQAATTTTLTSSLNPSHVNQSVTFTATVTGLYAGKTTGSVTFKQGTTVLGTAAVVGGKATLTHVFTKTGTFSISAHFSGDANNKASNSATVSQVVTP
jgi:hypothetical protein